MRRFLALTLIALATACADAENAGDTTAQRSDSVSAAPPESTGSPDTLAADPVARWTARLPAGSLRRDGACPFECCLYGQWTADSRITLLETPESGGAESGELAPGESFSADSGFVQVTGVALIAVTDTVTPMPNRSLEPGDTLVLLDYVGEGFHTAWLDGDLVEVADFWSSATDRPRGEVIGEHASEWWVHATADDASGWFRADAEGVQLSGADACG